ncbi:MAG: sigma-70 family RNA polymerase sigma factor [Bacteroidota bacterium]
MVPVIKDIALQNREVIILQWYEEVFPKAAAYIQRRGGNLEEAKEVFQESLIVCYEKLSANSFFPEVSNEAYLMGILKKRWLKYQSKPESKVGLEGLEIAEEKIQKPLSEKLLHYLKQSGERCMDLLQSFYYEKLTMRQLADRFGYANERSVTVQKYKCLEKMRDRVKQKSLTYEDFLD